jgi:HAE1 family hydrophobic/amphiphilic exporter-1
VPRESPWTEPETTPLPVGPGVHGRVGDRSGRALRGVEVSLFDVGGELVTSTQTAPDGTYRIDVEAGGEYVVAARSGEREPVAELVTVNGGPAWYDLTVDGPAAVTGVVRDPGGQGVLATVTLVDDRGEVVAAGRTAAAGRYELRDVAAGEYHLLVAAAGTSATTRITVPATGSVATEIDMPPAPVGSPG